jgi:hypothetical protein
VPINGVAFTVDWTARPNGYAGDPRTGRSSSTSVGDAPTPAYWTGIII